MISRSNNRDPIAGVSLLEMLVVLGVLAVLVSMVAGRSTGPSPRLEAEWIGTDLVADALDARLEAMVQVREIPWAPNAPGGARRVSCDPAGSKGPVLFAPSGQALGGPLCFEHGGGRILIRVDWLTGLATAEVL